MCNRHVAHMIAEYEAAKLDEDADDDQERAEAPEPPESSRQEGLLAAVVERLVR